MRAMVLRRAASLTDRTFAPLELVDTPRPRCAPDGVVLRVDVCAVCRTDLDLAEGRLVPPRYPVIPGHQVVGRVVEVGNDVRGVHEGERRGVAWINSADGRCRWCKAGNENLCPAFRATGCDVDGGYAEYVAVPAAFTHVIPDALTDSQAAPLLCAGAVGIRSLRLTNVKDGEPLGFTGFGASAHLVLQIARKRFPASPVFVFARNARERDFALHLGATWAGNTHDDPPALLAAIIDTTPAWTPVLAALARLAPGGRLVVNAIRKSNADERMLMELDYAKHLWMERSIQSVANVTRADVRECLDFAATEGIRPTVEEMALERANEALRTMREGGAIVGAKVLRVSAGARERGGAGEETAS